MGLAIFSGLLRGPRNMKTNASDTLAYRQLSVHRGGTNNSHWAQLYGRTAEQHGQDNPPEAVETSWATRHCTLVYTRCASLRKPTQHCAPATGSHSQEADHKGQPPATRTPPHLRPWEGAPETLSW